MRRIQQKRSHKSTEASLSITRHYVPDLARQVKALLRLLESCGTGTMRKQHGEDVAQRDESLSRKEVRNDEME